MESRAETLSHNWKDGIFDSKIVFCTGGAGDICSGIVRALVYLGADACIVGRNAEKTEKMARELAQVRPGARVLGYGAVDVRDYQILQGAVSRCVKELGGLDFVIAGAAGNFVAPITQLSPRGFKSVIDIDLLGSYNVSKAALPYLERSAAGNRSSGVSGKGPAGGTCGRIIFISATLHYRGVAMQAHGCAAKAGIDALSSVLALEMGPRGITSNVIAPGPIAGTEGLKRLSELEGYGNDGPKIVPSGRFGSVKEVADAAIFLFSDAGSYVNGATLAVDGGAWRTQGANDSRRFPYPDYLLSLSTKENRPIARL